MTFQQAFLLLSLHLIPLSAAAEPAPVHEVRGASVSTDTISLGPGPASAQTSSSTSKATTMVQSTSPSSSASSTSPATPQPSPSASGIVFSIHNMTTCTSGLISWNYSGTEDDLSLSITNIDVNDTPSRLKARQSTANTTIQQLTVTNATAQVWTWPSVNVTQGWYEVEGTTSTVKNNSAPFFISNGTDLACLTVTSPQISSTATSSVNVGIIVGSVLGAITGVVLLIVGIYLWRQKKLRRVAGGVRDVGSKNRKWGSLKSTNSSIQPDGSGAPTTHFHAHSESMAAMLQDDEGGKPCAMVTPGGSIVDVVAAGKEKLVSPTSSSRMSPFEVLNTPVHHDHYTLVASVPVNNEGTRSAVSRRISNQSLEQQAQRIRSSMETSARRRSERISAPTTPSPTLCRIPPSPTNIQSKEEYPLSPVTSPTPVNRTTSTSSMTPRRASRKPVPHYDPSLLEDTYTDSVSTGAESSQSHGTGMTYGTPSDFAHHHHNASFGDGRPVHYLIPDMPPPQQD